MPRVLVGLLGRHDAFVSDADQFPWLAQIGEGHANVVDVFVVADDRDSVENDEPAWIGADRTPTRTDFSPSEAALILGHEQLLVAPEHEIWTLSRPDLTECIGALERGIQPVDLLRKQHRVAKARTRNETLEFKGSHVFRRQQRHTCLAGVSAVGHVVGVIDLRDTRIVLHAGVLLVVLVFGERHDVTDLPVVDAVAALGQDEEVVEVVALAAQDHHVLVTVFGDRAVVDPAAVVRDHVGRDDGVVRIATNSSFLGKDAVHECLG